MKRFLRNIRNRSKKGFTLVELIVVIAIVAILTAVSIAGYYGFLAYSNQSAADQEATQFKTAIMSRMSLSYKGKTSSISSTVGVSNSKGIRIYSEVGDEHPEVGSLTLLGEAFTYVEAPSAFNKGGFNVDYDGIIFCDGSKTDGHKPAIYTPKILEENNDGNITYYITGVTYQSKNGYESKVEFGDSSGSYDLVVSSVNSMLEPSSIEIVGGLKETYYANEVIDTSNIKALVTFEDGSSAVVGSESLDIQVVNTGVSSSHKSLVVKNSNSMVIGTNRKIIVTYKNSKNQSITNENAKVYNNAPELSVNTQEVIVSKPANILESERVKNIDPNKESGFFRNLEDKDFKYYFVGTANEFKFEPKVTVIENGKTINIVADNNEINHVLYSVDESVEPATETLLDGKMTFSNGEKTRINFADDLNGYYKLVTTIYGKSFETYLKIIPGFNVYNANDLKKFDNQNPRNVSNCGNGVVGSHNNMQYLSPFVVYDENQEEEHGLSNVSNPSHANAFTGNNYKTAGDEYNVAADVAHDGIILQTNVVLTANCFDKHIFNNKGQFINARLENKLTTSELNGKSTTKADDYRISILRRDVDAFQNYVFEGNYFTIDSSKLPLREFDELSDNPYTFSQPSLIDFGYNYDKEWCYYYDSTNDRTTTIQDWDENVPGIYKTACLNRVNIIGNSPKSSNKLHQGGFKLVMNSNLSKLFCNYVNTRNGYMSYEIGANSGGMDISYSKGYDSWNAQIDLMGGGVTSDNARKFFYQNKIKFGKAENEEYLATLKSVCGNAIYNALENKDAQAFYKLFNGGTHVDHCEFKNCGGPVFLKQLHASNTTYAYIPTLDITNSTLESIVLGTEAWFQVMGKVEPAIMLKGIFDTIPSKRYKVVSDEGYFNFVSVELTNWNGYGGVNTNVDIVTDMSSQLPGNQFPQNLLPDYTYNVTGKDSGININNSEKHNIGPEAHGVIGYDLVSGMTRAHSSWIGDNADKFMAQGYNLKDKGDQTTLAACIHEWMEPYDPTTSYVTNAYVSNYVEAVNYTSIDHVKYYNIDKTTFANIAMHAFDIVVKGKQQFNDDMYVESLLESTLNTNINDYHNYGYYSTAQYSADGTQSFSSANAFPYCANGHHAPEEVFMSDSQYLGFITHAMGLGAVVGLYRK